MTIARRTFILSASATAAGAAALLSWRGEPSDCIRWCARPVYPLADKRILLRGFQSGKAEIILRYMGPKLSEWRDADVQTVLLHGGEEALSLRLPNVHAEYVAGQHTFIAVIRQSQVEAQSDPIVYELRPFTFGA